MMGRAKFMAVALMTALAFPAAAQDDEFTTQRAMLADQVVAHARFASSETGVAEIGADVLEAIRSVPRHLFVAREAAPLAYFDMPLPAAHGLRESQPFIVALMSELVRVPENGDVLILGMGGGYHAAVASRLAGRVNVLDLDPVATGAGMARLDELGHDNVEARVADPYFGWPQRERLFDAIVIRLAVDAIPPAVLRQLRPGGRLIAPVGRAEDRQDLVLVEKSESGEITRRSIMPVIFMRLPGGERI